MKREVKMLPIINPQFSAMVNDVRFGLRMLWKNPGFTAVAILTLGLGIGASTAMYSVVNTMLLNPVPGPEPERLIQIAERHYDNHQEQHFIGVSPPVLEALMANQDFFSDFAWFDSRDLERKTEDFVEEVPGAMVSSNFFTLWNVQPLLGRTFAQDEAVPLKEDERPARDTVIVLSYSLWKSLFGGDAGVLGKTIELSGCRYTVIGVMPSYFVFPAVGYTKFWVAAEPWRLPPDTIAGPNTRVLARLKPGVTEPQVQAILDTVAKRLMKEHPPNKRGYGQWWARQPQGLGFWIRPLRFFYFQEGYGSEDLRRTLFGLLGAIGFVLLIVCVNIANLTLARTERRQQELAVRAAMGAGRVRLMRQLLTESVLLGCLGGLGGLAVTVWGMKLLITLVPESMPRLRAIQMDGHALGFTLLVSVMTGLVFGLAPAWHGGRSRLSEALKRAGTGATAGMGRSRYRSALVVAEVALTLVLLAGAGLMIESVVRLLHVNPGFDPENLLFVDVHLPWAKYGGYEKPKNDLRNALFAQLHERLSSLPGVQAVGIGKGNFDSKFNTDDRAEEVFLYSAGSGVEESDLFRAIGVPLLAGRYLNKSDIGERAGTVLINESMARLCWLGENAAGKKFREPGTRGRAYEVVGVVGDARTDRYDEQVRPTFYRPYHEFDLAGRAPRFVIRTRLDPRGLIAAIRKELKSAEPEMRTPTVFLCRQALYDATQAQRTYVLYLVVFAGAGLVLSAIGLYGVLAYSVAARTREIGIRMAVGAERRQVLGMVMAEGARMVSIGVAVGLLAAFWLTRLLRSQLFEVSPTDPVVFTVVVLLLFAVALLACFFPARRAAIIDPMEALRNE